MTNKDIFADRIVLYKEVSKEEFQNFINFYNNKWFTTILFPTDPYQEYYIKDDGNNCVDNIIAKISSYDGVQNSRYWIAQEVRYWITQEITSYT